MAEDDAGISPELKFLREFSKRRDLISNEEDAIQYRTSSCYVNENDFDGEVTDWALQYLYSHQCPHSLAAAVARVTRDELKLADLSLCQLQENGESYTSQVFDANNLQQIVRRKVHEICDQWQNQPIFTAEKQKIWPVSTCAVKNSRRRMEDRHVVIPDLNIFFGLQDKSPQGFFAIFDGHAGVEAASYASAHLHHHIVRHPHYGVDIHNAVKDGFMKTDELFIEKCKRDNLKCGSTALCTIIQENEMHVAWVGDSQAFLIRKGDIKDIVSPHKPSRDDERKRIEDQGGCVVHFGTLRVNGTLAISRAIGDSEYKPYVSSEPDIVTIPFEGNEDFLIMACDGLWDVASPEDAAFTVYQNLTVAPDNIDDVSEKLVQLAVQRSSQDNITVIVVFLRSPNEISKDGVPDKLKNVLNLDSSIPIHQESKLPEGIITNGESPTKISSNLWMNDPLICNLHEARETPLEMNQPERELQPPETISEYFLPQTEDDMKNSFHLETEMNLESTSSVSLSTFDSTGAMATPSPLESPETPKDEIKMQNQVPSEEELLVDFGVLSIESESKSPENNDLNAVVTHSNLSPSAPEFIPHSFVAQSQMESEKIFLDEDQTSSIDDLITVESIPDSAPVAEDVVDDESEEGEDWRYLKMPEKIADENVQCESIANDDRKDENVQSTEITQSNIDNFEIGGDKPEEILQVTENSEVANLPVSPMDELVITENKGISASFNDELMISSDEKIFPISPKEELVISAYDEISPVSPKEELLIPTDETTFSEPEILSPAREIIFEASPKDELLIQMDETALSEPELSSPTKEIIFESAPKQELLISNDEKPSPSSPHDENVISPASPTNELLILDDVKTSPMAELILEDKTFLNNQTEPLEIPGDDRISPISLKKSASSELIITEDANAISPKFEKPIEKLEIETSEPETPKIISAPVQKSPETSKTPVKTQQSTTKSPTKTPTKSRTPLATTKTRSAPTKTAPGTLASKPATLPDKKTTKPLTKAASTATTAKKPEKTLTKTRTLTGNTTEPPKTSKPEPKPTRPTTTTTTTRPTTTTLRKTTATAPPTKTTSPATITSTSKTTSTRPLATTSTIKRTTTTTTTLTRNTTTTKPTSTTKDSKETVNKQILTKNLTKTTTKAPPLKKSASATAPARPTTLKKTVSTTTTTGATASKTLGRPSTAPPARPRPATASLKAKSEPKKEKGSLDEKSKEGQGDEASIRVDSTGTEECTNANSNGCGDLA